MVDAELHITAISICEREKDTLVLKKSAWECYNPVPALVQPDTLIVERNWEPVHFVN